MTYTSLEHILVHEPTVVPEGVINDEDEMWG